MSKRYPGNFITGNPVALSQTSNNGVWDLKDNYQATNNGTWQEGDGIYEISRSLRFRSSATAYLSRTPTTAGNTQKFTESIWIKRGKISTTHWVGVTVSGNASYGMYIDNNDSLYAFIYYTGSVWQGQLYTTQLFRDPAAWYHIVLAVDTTQTMTSNRVKIYVNGVQVSSFTTENYPNQNQTLNFNSAAAHFINQLSSSSYYDGYIAELNWIDGYQLDPSYFGYNDSITNIWHPKRYTGSYGTNGFYLPFNVDTTFSTDFLVVAGGGSGGSNRGGGGGGGGFRTSAGTSGANSAAETPLTLATGVAYTVTVGAGGGSYSNGANSVLGSVTSLGGGRAGGASEGPNSSGGSGGGGSGDDETGAVGTAAQGFAGGNGEDNGGSGRSGGGGGGAGQVGATAVNGTFTAGNGGNGLASTISGSSVTYAAGGGGGHLNNGTAGTAGTGGSGGLGGAGASGGSGGAGGSASSNTGSGGGGAAAVAAGGSGGSGIVVIKIPSTRTAFFSSGVTFSGGTASGGFRIYTVTATSTTSETVTFA